MSDTFGEYLDRIGAVPLLTKADEQRLGRLIMEGREAAEKLKSDPDNRALRRAVRAGERAKEEMIAANLRLVVSTVRRQFGPSQVDTEDLVQYGNMGLIHAVEKFDYRMGFKFSTYAVNWIRQAVARGIIETNPGLKMTYSGIAKIRAVARARIELTTTLGHEPSTQEIASSLGLAPDEVRRVISWGNTPTSLDECVDETPLYDIVRDPHAEDPMESAVESAAQTHATALGRAALLTLRPQDRHLIEMRMGFGQYERTVSNDTRGHGGMTQREIACALGVSLEAVRQRESRILRQLRVQMSADAMAS